MEFHFEKNSMFAHMQFAPFMSGESAAVVADYVEPVCLEEMKVLIW